MVHSNAFRKIFLKTLFAASIASLGLIVVLPVLHGQQAVDFSRFVVAGDSLSAGYQNSQLVESGQVHGYANVIAIQAKANLQLPLVPAPGYPQITIQDGFAAVTGINPTPRLNSQQTLAVAVPGFTLGAFVGLQAVCPPDYANPIVVMAQQILNPNCSSPAPTGLAEASALRPTTSILWIGNNDVLLPILLGGNPTDTATFGYLYHIAVSAMAQSSGTLVIANIPDVTSLPYLTSLAQLANILNLPLSAVQLAYGLNTGDMVTPYAFPAIQAMGNNPSPLPESGPNGPIVLRASLLDQIRTSVLAYNKIIADEAAANGATLVDIYSLVNDLTANGVKIGSQQFTTDFGGGLFSLDGVHPTDTGYAVIANEFIKTMNRQLNANLQPVSLQQVSKTDPLITSDKTRGKNSHVSAAMADALRSTRR